MRKKDGNGTKKQVKDKARYTSAGVGIFSLGLVTTLVLLFICRYAENRNKTSLRPLTSDNHIYISASVECY